MTFKKAHTREEVSKLIQKEGMKLKEILSYFNREAICITWPSEMKYVLKKYGLKVTKVDGIDKLNPKEDIAIALVHGKFFTHEYHWLVFPIDEIKNFYGNKTVVDIVYLLTID